MVWKMYTNNQKWVRIFKRKYLNSDDPVCIVRTLNPPRGSAIQNFICESRDIICKYATWEVHNGRSASFWEDSWDGHSKLGNMLGLVAIKVETIRV